MSGWSWREKTKKGEDDCREDRHMIEREEREHREWRSMRGDGAVAMRFGEDGK